MASPSSIWARWKWKDDETASSFRPTGLPELELVYTANTALDRIYMDAVRERTKTRTMTLKPITDLYFGEGQPLYKAGMPTISLIPTPDYLCAAPPGGYIEKLDPRLQYEQIETFARVLAALDKAPADEITAEEFQLPSLVGGIARIVNLIQGRG